MEVATENAPAGNTANAPNTNGTEPKPQPPADHVAQKKSKKEDRSKKEDKSVDQFMKSLNSVPSLDEKYSLVCKKYVQTAEESKKLQFYIKQSDKRYAMLTKEKEQLQHEFNKTILVKSKLENLCRELQKQNKAIKEESLLKIREEEERRKETQVKFQTTLGEITTLLQQNNDKNAKLRDDNINMSEKFKAILQQHQLREQQVEKMSKQMALENQLSETKLQKANLEHQAEKGRLLADMEQLKMEVAQGQAKISELQSVEVALRNQISVYTEKYDEFQNALVKSNQVFGGFKGEMEKMSKKIQKLEKESLSWKKRWETSQTALIDMCTERESNEQKAHGVRKQLYQMQSLCRTMQAERTQLINILKENNIDRPPVALMPAPPPQAPPTSSDDKVETMAANCAQLKQSLAQLQNQLNVLTTKKEESPKPEKTKKKSKKNKSAQNQVDTQEKQTTEQKTENLEDKVSALKIESTTDSVANTESKVDSVANTESKVESVAATESIVAPVATTESKTDSVAPAESIVDLSVVSNADVSLDTTSNDEAMHLNEVKPIANASES